MPLTGIAEEMGEDVGDDPPVEVERRLATKMFIFV